MTVGERRRKRDGWRLEGGGRKIRDGLKEEEEAWQSGRSAVVGKWF